MSVACQLEVDISEQCFCQNFQLNHLYKCKETKQYKFDSIKEY